MSNIINDSSLSMTRSQTFIWRIHKIFMIFSTLFKVNIYPKVKYILVDTPEHGNLGDQAIAISEVELLTNITGKKQFIELSYNEIGNVERIYKKIIPDDVAILLQGGGFMGSLWKNEEERVRNIFTAFSFNKIIVFPQTVYFISQDAYYQESKNVYNQNKKIYFFTREKKSFQLLKKMGCSHVFLCPDMVCKLKVPHKIRDNLNREGVLVGFRSDKEKTLSGENLNEIKDILHDHGFNRIQKISNVLQKSVNRKTRKKEVMNKLIEISKAQLVITDRLHLMLFAAITNTPCIALDNKSGKVRGVYETIKNNEYIQFANSVDEIEEKLEYILNLKTKPAYKLKYTYDNLENCIINR